MSPAEHKAEAERLLTKGPPVPEPRVLTLVRAMVHALLALVPDPAPPGKNK